MWQCGTAAQYNRLANLTASVSWNFTSFLSYMRRCTTQTDPSRNFTGYYGSSGAITLSTYNNGSTPYNSIVVEAFKSANYSYNSDYMNGSYNGIFNFQGAVKVGARQTAEAAFLYPVKARNNLFTMKNSFVRRILINAQNQTTGVEVVVSAAACSQTVLTLNVRGEVILTAGAINTPKVLMNSGVGPADQLAQFGIAVRVNRSVGFNLRDNPICTSFFTANLTASANVTLQALKATSDYYNYRNGSLVGIGSLSTQAMINLTTTDPAALPDCGFRFTTFRRGDASLLIDSLVRLGFNDSYIAYLANLTAYYDVVMCDTILFNAQSSGRVQLSANYLTPYANPIINTGYFSASADIQAMATAQNFLINNITKSAVFQASGAAFVDFGQAQFNVSASANFSSSIWADYLRFFTGAGYSFTGTAKMGVATDLSAVVNANFSVFGISKLRVCDASIFPTPPASGNLQCSLYAAAVAAADAIKAANP